MRQQYTSYDECVDFFKSAQKTNPNLFKVESIGKTWENRDIISVSITKDVDTNKTKAFFNDLSKKLDVQMKKISDDLEKGIIDTKEAGVEINEKHIHIDLNKTQNMLEDWGKKIRVFVQEFDEISENIENNNTN